MRAIIVVLLVAGVALARTYDALLTAETLALLTEDVLGDLGHYTRISLRGHQARTFYRGAAELWPDVKTPYLLGLWARGRADTSEDNVFIVLAAPSGTRLHEWRIYAAGVDGVARSDAEAVHAGELLSKIGAQPRE